MKAPSLFLSWLAPALLQAAELPPPELPQGVGVNIHFTTGHEADLDRIAAAGCKFIRMDFDWQATERKPGQYDWSAYDHLTTSLERRGLRALYILDYSNPLYESPVRTTNAVTGAERETGIASPQHPASVAAFARWAGAAAGHFRGQHIVWEIWNEPNIGFWKPKPDARQYATLALAAGKAIREADPQATLLGPATSEFPWEFMETVFQAGALDYFDGVSVHPYRNPRQGPETAATDYRRLRSLIDRYAPTAKRGKILVISGEWGYASSTSGVSLETQAAFLVRQQLANLLEGVPLSIWYDWKNDGSNPADNEHNFGTVLPELTPKPAYAALQTLTRELSGYRVVRRQAMGNDEDFVLVMTNAAGLCQLAVWTTAQPHDIDLRLAGQVLPAIPVTDESGAPGELKLDGGRLRLPLSAAPRYVVLGRAVLKE